MSHRLGSPAPRIGAVISHEVHSPRQQRIRQGIVAPKMDIIVAPREGATVAFDELQRLYSSRLFKTILQITKNWEDAEDALQDTFLRAYMALHRFQGRSSVYSWLTRIAINSALMILRRRRSRPEALLISSFEESDSDSPVEFKDSSSNPEQLCDQAQRKSQLLQAVRKLEPRLRVPIEVQLAGEHSMKSIANILNISVPAVKARLHRARARLAIRVSTHSGARKRMPFCVVDEDEPANLKNREQQWTICG